MNKELSRRDFLKSSLGGLALFAGCAAPSQNITKPEQFNINAFERWYRMNKLYNGPNPNLKSPHMVTDYTRGPTFNASIDRMYTPGIAYIVPAGEIMVAVAPGEVWDVGQISGTGRAGGGYVEIAHPLVFKDVHGKALSEEEIRDQKYVESVKKEYEKRNIKIPRPAYMSNFSHVAEPMVKIGQRVERGQPICGVPPQYREFVKIQFRELVKTGNDPFNHVDPDNYGLNHSYMDY